LPRRVLHKVFSEARRTDLHQVREELSCNEHRCQGWPNRSMNRWIPRYVSITHERFLTALEYGCSPPSLRLSNE
jgi:hypothetical protein